MPRFSPETLTALSAKLPSISRDAENQGRLISIWEITSWILPMAPEHLRRVLAAEPDLPQGRTGGEGTMRWFSAADLVALRAHFTKGPRKARYEARGSGEAPVVVMAGPLGVMGRSVTLAHLATAAALAGQRVLVIDGDPGGDVSRLLPSPVAAGTGVLSMIARSAALHLRGMNLARMERGDVPLPMEEALSAGLVLKAADLIRPSLWPGLDVMAAPPGMMQADRQIAGWRLALRSWQPGRALTQALKEEGLRQAYDLILCDTPRGLGTLSMALLTSADVVLAPFPLQEDGLARLGQGLTELVDAMTHQEAETQSAAQALGQSAVGGPAWRALWVLPNCAGQNAPRHLAQAGAALGDVLLPDAMPEITALREGQARQFYDLDYRQLGRVTYAALRERCQAAWRGLAERLLHLPS